MARVRAEVTGRKPRLSGEAEAKHGPPASIPIAAYSLPEFAEAHRFSLDFLFKLLRDGLGPDVMRINGRTIVGVEAASRWRKQREDATRKSKQEKAEIASEGETRPG
jgi:hypothetical protein